MKHCVEMIQKSIIVTENHDDDSLTHLELLKTQ